MKQLGIIIDSATGWTKEQANNRGWGFIPLHIIINKNDFKDGINLNDESFYKTLNINDQVSTACASSTEIEEQFSQFSKKYDDVLYLSISNDISAQNKIAKNIGKDYKNVYIPHSYVTGISINILLEKCEKLYNSGVKMKEILKRLEVGMKKSVGMIVPETMDWLKKGGRINKSTALLANLASIKPIIFFNGGMDKWGKGRTLSKTVLKALDGLKTIVEDNRDNEEDYDWYMLSAQNQKETEILQLLKNSLKEKTDLIFTIFPRILVIHVGPGAIALYIVPKKI